MFFETSPNWSSRFPRSGFPFEDDMPSTRQDIRSHLDDLAARHPEFADQLRGPPWAGDLGASWGKKRKESNSCDEDDLACQSNMKKDQPVPSPSSEEPGRGRPKNLHQYGLRNTVPLGPNKPDIESDEARAQRSMSAPPPDTRAQNPQRFVSRLNITPINPDAPQKQPESAQDSKDNSSKPPPSKQAGNVRHIPIFVEGRDKPVIPKVFEEEIPIPVHRETKSQSNFTQQQGPELFSSQPHSSDLKRDQPEQRAQTPKPQINDPISKVESIQKDVDELKNKVEKFAGTSKDKEYIYLDEMLTRNILKLDDIDTEGKENVRQARKEAIRNIQKCINMLESKVTPLMGPTNSESADQKSEEQTEDSSRVTSSTDIEMTEAISSNPEVASGSNEPKEKENPQTNITNSEGNEVSSSTDDQEVNSTSMEVDSVVDKVPPKS